MTKRTQTLVGNPPATGIRVKRKRCLLGETSNKKILLHKGGGFGQLGKKWPLQEGKKAPGVRENRPLNVINGKQTPRRYFGMEREI